ncbi:MAG: AarF/UbiB family protein [Caldilineaceae bacterium]
MSNSVTLSVSYDLVAMAEEFAVTIRGELDYRREAHNAELFQSHFADAAYIHLPQIYWGYTTRRVLTMERLDGIKIDEIHCQSLRFVAPLAHDALGLATLPR